MLFMLLLSAPKRTTPACTQAPRGAKRQLWPHNWISGMGRVTHTAAERAIRRKPQRGAGAKALFRQQLTRKWGHAIAREWATILLDRLRDFVVIIMSRAGSHTVIEGN